MTRHLGCSTSIVVASREFACAPHSLGRRIGRPRQGRSIHGDCGRGRELCDRPVGPAAKHSACGLFATGLDSIQRTWRRGLHTADLPVGNPDRNFPVRERPVVRQAFHHRQPRRHEFGRPSLGRAVDGRIRRIRVSVGCGSLRCQRDQGVVRDAARHVRPSIRAPGVEPDWESECGREPGLDFSVAATDADGDSFSFDGHNLPLGATFNSTTRMFHWQPATAGTYSSIVFNVSQNGAPALSDAEMIQIAVVPAAPSGALSFTLASYMTGERGPAVLLVNLYWRQFGSRDGVLLDD